MAMGASSCCAASSSALLLLRYVVFALFFVSPAAAAGASPTSAFVATTATTARPPPGGAAVPSRAASMAARAAAEAKAKAAKATASNARRTAAAAAAASGDDDDDDGAEPPSPAGAAATKAESPLELLLGRRDALRRFPPLASAAAVLLLSGAADANDDDESLTARMFNPDGSLRADANVESEARSITVELSFPLLSPSDSAAAVVSVDGASAQGGGVGGGGGGGGEGGGGGAVAVAKVSYALPAKWDMATPGSSTQYVDRSEGMNAKSAQRIVAYRLPGVATERTLDDATKMGVAKAVGMSAASPLAGYSSSILSGSADVVSGRKSVRDGVKYYEFDLAVAPEKCDGKSREDLGLGFCPYESIVLVGAAVAEGRMYVLTVESDRDMWKRANADLKRVRSSFRVEVPAAAAASSS